MLAILVGAGVLGLVLALGGRLAERRLLAQDRPSGRLIDLGGYRLHLAVAGDSASGGPTVVLEGGTWVPGIAWQPLAAEIARFARVVTYDRAGLGWSDPSPRPRRADVMANELHELLRRGGVPGPYLLVGHSFGGTIVRVFAHRHPTEVAGMVLLDGSHEDQFVGAPEPIQAMNARMGRLMPPILRLVGLLARSGLFALRPSLVPAMLVSAPAEVVERLRARIAARPATIDAMAAEVAELSAGNDSVRALGIESLGAIPLTVVSHGRMEGTPATLGPELAVAFEALWQELQARQMSLSTRGRRIVAHGIGHDIPVEAPDLVVRIVREVLAEATERPAA